MYIRMYSPILSYTKLLKLTSQVNSLFGLMLSLHKSIPSAREIAHAIALVHAGNHRSKQEETNSRDCEFGREQHSEY